ncbi:MAG: hypothetical protein GQ574_17450 [Crocinitomix sp.]|nr:hypothetical protein [Crocinitomix sp.]
MKKLILGIITLITFSVSAQNNSKASISGNIETNMQVLNEDTLIGAFAPTEKAVMNTVMNINGSFGKFRAGVRLESYLPAIAGYPVFYNGTGLGYRYAEYAGEQLNIKVGNFYEQFGNGIALRAYENSALGIDNAFDGVSIKFIPRRGVELKAIMGRQRFRFEAGVVEKSKGIIRGVDGDLNLNELIPRFSDSKFKVTVGGSFVSRFQSVNDTTPPIVNIYAGRIDMRYKRFTLGAEYGYKTSDPSLQSGFVYNPGHGAVVNLGYSQKGLGIILTGRSFDNFQFRSDKNVLGNQLTTNFLPATTNNHTYNLAGTLYPYAANPAGEVAYQLDVLYKIKKKTKLGGKYGTKLHLNVSVATDHMRHKTGTNPSVDGITYVGRPFDGNDSLYNFDFNMHISRKFSKKWKASLHYYNFIFNNTVNPVTLLAKGYIEAQVGVFELSYKIGRKHSIRGELQALFTEQDRGNWAAALLEYTISPKWFFAVQDQYNYGHPDSALQLHYLLGSFGYIHHQTRFIFSYGKQRAGIVCVGGVCRPVPATNGLSFTMTHSF